MITTATNANNNNINEPTNNFNNTCKKIQFLGLSSSDFRAIKLTKINNNQYNNSSLLTADSTFLNSDSFSSDDKTLAPKENHSCIIDRKGNSITKRSNLRSKLINILKLSNNQKPKFITAHNVLSATNNDQQMKMLYELCKTNLVSKYKLTNKTLGDGSNGKVFAVTKNSNNKVYAAKLHVLPKCNTKKQRKECITNIANEIILSSKMHHLNVACTIDLVSLKGAFYSVMEYCEYDLFDYMSINREKINNSDLLHFYVQLISGLSYIHHQNVVHRDIKLENICVTKNGILKIVDFGSATTFSNSITDYEIINYYTNNENNEIKQNQNDKIPLYNKVKGVCGSDPYMAPEVWTDTYYDGVKADTFSLGVVFVAMSSLKFMWDSTKSSDNKYKLFIKKNISERLEYFRRLKVPEVAIPFVNKMLSNQSNNRAVVSDAWDLEWVKNIVENSHLCNNDL